MTTETRLYRMDIHEDVAIQLLEWMSALGDILPATEARPPFNYDDPDNHRLLGFTSAVAEVLRGGGFAVGVIRRRRRFLFTIDEAMCLMLHAVNAPIGVMQVTGDADESFVKMCHAVRHALLKELKRHA